MARFVHVSNFVPWGIVAFSQERFLLDPPMFFNFYTVSASQEKSSLGVADGEFGL